MTADETLLQYNDTLDLRFKTLMTRFARFMRDNGYDVATESLLKFFRLYNTFDVFQLEDMQHTLNILISKNEIQYKNFQTYFNAYFNRTTDHNLINISEELLNAYSEGRMAQLERERQEQAKDLQDELNQLLNLKEQQETENNRALAKLLAERQEIEDKQKQSSYTYNRRKEVKEDEMKQWVEHNDKNLDKFLNCTELSSEDKQIAKLSISLNQPRLLNYLGTGNPDKSIETLDETMLESNFDKLSVMLNEIMITNLMRGNSNELNAICMTSATVITKLKDYLYKKYKANQKEFEEVDNQMHQVRESLSPIAEQISAKTQEIKEIDTIYDKEVKLIQKDYAKHHRDSFILGKNAVQTLLDPKLLDEEIETLEEFHYDTLKYYIKQNAQAFRTRVSQTMKVSKKERFDYSRTVRGSFSTFGVPIKLYYKTPRIKKTKIVAILDVSGSCESSSHLLIHFLYELADCFKGGVKIYTFQSDLADVSDSFNNQNLNIEEIATKAINAIPRDYSDYNRALTIFDSRYFNEITKDTIVLFLGDARNNKNESGEFFIRHITQTAKASFWLNTEPTSRWNKGDSIIGTYTPYMNAIYEILTTNDLIHFLETLEIN